jgi:ketosteroid isomerase-like protein
MTSPADPQQANVEVLGTLLDAFARRDFESLRPFIDDSGEVSSDPMGMNTGVFTGFDGFMTWLEAWLEAWEEFSVDVERFEPVGERHVVADVQQTARGRGSGVPVDLRLAYMWEFRDGKIVRMRLYPDFDSAMAEARRGEGGGE